MLSIALDENNDIFLDNYQNLALARDIEAVKTAVSCQTKTNYGEIILDTELGIPYFTTIFTAHPDIELWKTYMRQAVLQVPKVLSIQEFKTLVEKGILHYTMVINTEYGQGVIRQ